MPTWWTKPDYKRLAEVRKRITQLLIAKGLREGEGKWGAVFSRHLRKLSNWS